MKVIFCPISSFYPYQNSGPALSMFGFCKSLSDSNIKITVITRLNNLKLDTYNLKADSINKFSFGDVIYSSKNTFSYNLYLLNFFIRNRSRIDVVYLNSIFDFNNLPILILSILLKKKLIIAPRGELDPLALVYNKIVKKSFLSLYKLLLYFANKIQFHCTSLQELEFSKQYFDNYQMFILPNFQEGNNYSLGTFNTKKNYYLFIGRLDPKKGIENLINAYKSYVLKSCNPKKLYIVGKGSENYSKFLNQLVVDLGLTNYILFLGFKMDKEKTKLYQEAFFTVVPSHTENFANVIVESLSQATPVIASTGTPWSDLHTNVCGFWVDNSSFTLCKTLLHCDSLEKDVYNKYSFNSRIFFETNFSLETGRLKWLNVLNEFV